MELLNHRQRHTSQRFPLERLAFGSARARRTYPKTCCKTGTLQEEQYYLLPSPKDPNPSNTHLYMSNQPHRLQGSTAQKSRHPHLAPHHQWYPMQ